MASLIKCSRTAQSLFSDDLMPLSLMGFGSMKSLLELKYYEIDAIKKLFKEEEIQNLFAIVHNIPLN